MTAAQGNRQSALAAPEQLSRGLVETRRTVDHPLYLPAGSGRAEE